jgi:hypothetical protein
MKSPRIINRLLCRAAAAAIAFVALQTATAIEAAAAASPPAAPMGVQLPNSVVIEATQVLRAADVVAQSLARSGRIPTGVTVALTNGKTETLSAAQIFVMLSRFLGNGYEEGLTPEYTPQPPPMIGPLERSDTALPTSTQRVITTADLLAQTRATADVAESTGHLPAAVWVAGQRLTPSEFLGAMATMLQHAAYSGQVPDQLAIGTCLPPLDWGIGATADTGPAALRSGAFPLANGAYASPPGGAYAPLPLTEAPEPAPLPPPPKLALYLPEGASLKGEQSITVEYEGPPAFLRLSIDGAGKAVSNMARLAYLWDTRLEADRSHVIEATAVDDTEKVLTRVERKVETANGNFPLH